MRIRRLVKKEKITESAGQWSTKDLQPRYAPIYAKTKPIRAGWQWRSSKVVADGEIYILLAECNPGRGNWNAKLIRETVDGFSVVARFESHASHPGLHVHAHCDRGGIETRATGLDNLARIPPIGVRHRRTNAWTETTFWEAAKRFFCVREEQGVLDLDAP
jgi:hypothetical protein